MRTENHAPFLYQLLELLLRYHRYLGLDHEQFVLLHTCIQYDDLEMIEEITGFHSALIVSMLEELIEQNIIVYDKENGIDLEHLFTYLQMIERRLMPFRQLLIREYVAAQQNPDQKHVGQVELIPMKKGIAVRLNDGKLLSLKRMEQLSEELLNYVAYVSAKQQQNASVDDNESDSQDEIKRASH